MRILLFAIVALILLGCQSDSTSLNCDTKLNYYRIGHQRDSTSLDNIKKYWSREIPDLTFIKKNDTLFASYRTLEGDRNILFEPWITSENRFNSKLSCQNKLVIRQSEIEYTFCYSDVFEFLDSQIEKSKTDSYFISYKNIKDNLLQSINSNQPNFNCKAFIYDLLKNIPFKAYDNFQKKEIYKTIVNEFSMGWQGGIEYFLLENNKDTIAHYSYIKWIQ